MPVDALPPKLRELLSVTSRLATELGSPVYLVGGAVRDLLLGRPVLDVDLAVDGDATLLGRTLAEALGARLTVHAAFGTAAIDTEEGSRLDLATVRRESYAAEAALPQVFPGTLREDLLRRDFTVNSMALALEDLGYPELVDPSGGRADLAKGLLRVHHERSFLDDPTRILRGVRFEARLDLAFEVETERWAREAIASGVFDLLSADRLAAEIELVLSEDADVAIMWRRLEELGLLAAIGFAPAPATPERLAAVCGLAHEWRGRYGDNQPLSPSGALQRAALFDQPVALRPRLGERLRLPPTAITELDGLADLAALLTRPEVAPHRLNGALEGLSAEALVLLLSRSPGTEAAARVHAHLTEQRPLRLRIDGETLLARGFPPGPGIGRALRATRDARLDRRIGADDELTFAIANLRAETARAGGER
jgi:tRNA nucleotidyltransferase (CCA-adding enzyme)